MQGVCADCWGSKGGRQFWIRKQRARAFAAGGLLGLDRIRLAILVCYALAAIFVTGLLLWIST